eukprot:382274-Amphidinium_carterae.1
MNLKALIRKAKDEKVKEDDKASTGEEAGERFMLEVPTDLQPFTGAHRVEGLHDVYVVNDWLPNDHEELLVETLRLHSAAFTQLRGKRTACFGGDPGPPAQLQELPGWLTRLCSAVSGVISPNLVSGDVCPNHVLINHYRPGEGIMPHTDGPAYAPWAAILSLCSPVVFEFWRDHEHAASSEAST